MKWDQAIFPLDCAFLCVVRGMQCSRSFTAHLHLLHKFCHNWCVVGFMMPALTLACLISEYQVWNGTSLKIWEPVF